MSSLFCRHNRFTADCPICSKGTVLDARGASSPGRAPVRREPRRARAAAAGPPRFTGPYAAAGPYEDGDGERYEVRLERVPGGLRLAEWAGGSIRRRAPVVPAAGVSRLLEAAAERGLLDRADLDAVAAAPAEPEPGAPFGASPGRSGELSDELRVERLDAGLVRIARWTLRPGKGWLIADAPPMLPAARYVAALRQAARRGVLAG